MTPKVTSALILVFACIMGCLAVAFTNGAGSLQASRDDSRIAGMTGDSILQINLVLSDVKDADTGERQYLLSGDVRCLDRCLKARQRVDAELRTLKRLLNASPEQRRRVDDLQAAIVKRLSTDEKILHLRKQNRVSAAWAIAQAANTPGLMLAIESASASLQHAQAEALSKHVKDAESTTLHMTDHVKNIVLLLVGAVILCLALLVSELIHRRRLERALTKERQLYERQHGDLRTSADQYRLIVETTQEGVWVIDRSGKTTYVNARMAALLGFPPQEILGRKHTDFMDVAGRSIAEENMRRRKEGKVGEEDFRFVRRDGSTLWARVVTSPMTDANDNFIGTLTMVTDITQKKHVEEALQLHDSAFAACSNGIVIVDAQKDDLPIVSVNPAFEQITGFRSAEVVGRSPVMLEGEDRAQRNTSGLGLARQQRRDVYVETCNRRKDGTEYWTELFVAPIIDRHGALTHFVGILNDITARRKAVEALQRYREELEEKVDQRTAELKEANERLTTLATEDGLTGLKNRRIFNIRLEEEVNRSLRYGAPLSLMLLDVDHFKKYNDKFGHPAGDDVLRTVGKVLMESSRTTDLVARYGGEEFAIIMINTDEAGSMVLAERVRQSIEQSPWELRQVTASIGVASLTGDVRDPESFLKAADGALYAAKEGGRNRVATGAQSCTALAVIPAPSLP